MAEYALLNENGEVVNVIVADQEFIDSLQSQIDDDSVDTGPLVLHSVPIRIDHANEKPGVGWKRAGNKWVSPPAPEPAPPAPSLEDEILSDPALSGLSAAEKTAVAKAIRKAQGKT